MISRAELMEFIDASEDLLRGPPAVGGADGFVDSWG